MAVDFIFAPPSDPSPQDPPHVVELRRKVSLLIHERDRVVERAEQAEGQVARLRAGHKHSLSLRCDRPRCDAQISVSSAHATKDGELARGLFLFARTVQWLVGRDTCQALAALGAGSDVAITGNSALVVDVCPACRPGLAPQ